MSKPAEKTSVKILLGLCLAALCWSNVWADTLYQVEVPVIDQSSREKEKALRLALMEVLVRASGQPATVLESNGVLVAGIRKPEDYLLEYRYLALPEPAEEQELEAEAAADGDDMALPLDSQQAGGSSEFNGEVSEVELADEPRPSALLQASFSPLLLRELMTRAAIPLWPVKRPSVLVWWQVEELNPDSGRKERGLRDMQTFQKEAKRRGLPVLLPMGDQRDGRDLDGLWHFDERVAQSVMERYGVDAMLVGRGVASPVGWSGQWLFYFRGERSAFPRGEAGFPPSWHQAKTPEKLEAAGIQSAIDVLLQYYAIEMGGVSQRVELVISGVNALDSYAQVVRYLQTLEPVSAINLLKVESAVQHYQLNYDGSLSVLQELLGLGGILIEEEPPVEVIQSVDSLSNDSVVLGDIPVVDASLPNETSDLVVASESGMPADDESSSQQDGLPTLYYRYTSSY